MRNHFSIFVLVSVIGVSAPASAEDIKVTELYSRIKDSVDAVPAIDTHDHLRVFDELPHRVKTPRGTGMTLYSIWAGSYYGWTNPLTPWPAAGEFDAWWAKAQHDFDNARATSFYRYLLPAFRDLYYVDFDAITADQACTLSEKIFDNYLDDKWLHDVVENRANIELMFIDPYWNHLSFTRDYRFAVPVLNVTTIIRSSHPDQLSSDVGSPFDFARREGMKTDTLDDYLEVVDAIFQKAVAADVVCLKSIQAYLRTLQYQRVKKSTAAHCYGLQPEKIGERRQKEFEDFMFWHVCELSAKYNLPFQVHTGQARVQGSNPILLVDVIEANPLTKFILFHGGYPWIGETAVIAMRHKNVWIDSCWLPTLSYTTAKRAYQEWLEAVPSDRIMWGADTVNAEGIYAATEFTRQCLSEALAEKVDRGELREDHAKHIGRKIMRDNALKLFPKLRRMLWRNKIQD